MKTDLLKSSRRVLNVLKDLSAEEKQDALFFAQRCVDHERARTFTNEYNKHIASSNQFVGTPKADTIEVE